MISSRRVSIALMKCLALVSLFLPASSGFANSVSEQISKCQKLGVQAFLEHLHSGRARVPPPSVGRRPKELAGHLKAGGMEDWFMISIELPAEQLDPVYLAVAKAKKGDIVMGGVDVAHVSLGLSKPLGDGVHDINDLPAIAAKSLSPEDFLEQFSRNYDVVAPPFQSRTRPLPAKIDVNWEAVGALEGMMKAKKAGVPFSYEHVPHPVAFRGSAVIHVPRDGTPARIIFRTFEDYKRYLSRTLHVAEAGEIELKNYLKESNSDVLDYVLTYNVRMGATGARRGWSFDQESLNFLKGIKKALTPEDLKKVTDRLQSFAERDGYFSSQDINEIFRQIDAAGP